VAFDGAPFELFPGWLWNTLPPCKSDPERCRPTISANEAERRVRESEEASVVDGQPLKVTAGLTQDGEFMWRVSRPGNRWCPVMSVDAVDGSLVGGACLGE
jgi:hypothetical protein